MAPRSIVITGASSGLGSALAESYAAPGVRLGLLGRDRARLAAVGERCQQRGACVVVHAVDVRSAPEMASWLADFDDESPIDLLIANAGVCGSSPDGSSSEGVEAAAWQIETNLLGAVNAVEPVATPMRRRGRGQIAIISSTAGYRGIPFMPAYCASKAGLRIYGEALRALLAPAGVAVTVVTPSFFDSPMTDAFLGAKPGILSLPQATAAIRSGIEARKKRVVLPVAAGLIMQLLDWAPAGLGDWVLRKRPIRVVSGGLSSP